MSQLQQEQESCVVQGSQDEGYLQPSVLGFALGVALVLALEVALKVVFEQALGVPSGV